MSAISVLNDRSADRDAAGAAGGAVAADSGSVSSPSPLPDAARHAARLRMPACQACGEAARVQLLASYRKGRPVHRRYCVACFSACGNVEPEIAPSPSRTGWRVLLGVLGIVLVGAGLLFDYVVPDAKPGFGWQQRGAVALAAVTVLAGILFRADLVVLVGAVGFVGALSMDLVGMAHGPGIGWKQQVVILIGGTCLAVALARRLIGTAQRMRSTGSATPELAHQPS